MKSEPIEVRGRKWNATSPQTHRERNPCPCKEMGATASKYCYTFITNSSPVSRRPGDKEGPGRRLYFQGSLFTDVIAAWQFRWRSPWGLLATSFPGLLAGWGKDPGNEVGLFGFTLQVSQYKNVYGCKAPAKRGHTVAATLRPTMLPVCGKTRHHCCAPLDTARNVSEVFFVSPCPAWNVLRVAKRLNFRQKWSCQQCFRHMVRVRARANPIPMAARIRARVRVWHTSLNIG